MEIILSAAVSLDGFLNDLSPDRLKLSSAEDWAAVQELRASCDAILVGAGTVRTDNPSLVIRDPRMRAWRREQGMDEDITKVTVTGTGNLDPDAAFFREGGGRKIVFAPLASDTTALEPICETIKAEEITAAFIRDALAERGYRRLMIEGGRDVHTMFLTAGVGDRLRLAIAPFFVGDTDAPRFVDQGTFPWNKDNRMSPESIEILGDTVVICYKLTR